MGGWIAGILSTLWFGAIALYLTGWETGIASIDKLLKLEPNNFGDFMSGAFAPAAFFWLAYSVTMQRQELRLQREELKETRDVLSQQKEEMKTSAAATEEMAQLQNRQIKLQSKITSHQLFNFVLQNYKDYISNFGGVGINIKDRHAVNVYFCIIYSDGRPTKFRTGVEIRKDIENIISIQNIEKTIINDENINRLRRILFFLKKLKSLIEDTDEKEDGYKIYQAMELQMATESIEKLFDRIGIEQ